ncbi:phosphatidylinositol-specific phospholipase C domain-containing protein [Rhodococcus gannanensis]|uniref:Phosphatidylinositol-specific phospholipase C domain-containing protein n=1 Tax=Rhodococcus gannanensis TaxID=1960308 RepID=A0ABW4P4J4_9NOCA
MSRAVVRLVVISAVVAVMSATASASAEGHGNVGGLRYDQTTSVGVHNAYETATYPYLVDALDAGAALIELDVWTNVGGIGWRVSHQNPVANENNCVGGGSVDGRSGPRNGDLAACLTDLRTWHDAHPAHPPVLVKIEMKDGFSAVPVGGSAGSEGSAGIPRGPVDFDALVRETLGDAVYTPAELLGDAATLDDAVRARGWPTRDELAGRFVIDLISGTVEEVNPFDALWTDREYAAHLRDLAASDDLTTAVAFPAVNGAAPGDPRLRYSDDSLRPWLVVFDGDASAYVDGGIDTGWYRDNNYLLVMTAAHAVAPAIDNRVPDPAAATARVTELAGRSANVITSDWATLPSVLSLVEPRR